MLGKGPKSSKVLRLLARKRIYFSGRFFRTMLGIQFIPGDLLSINLLRMNEISVVTDGSDSIRPSSSLETLWFRCECFVQNRIFYIFFFWNVDIIWIENRVKFYDMKILCKTKSKMFNTRFWVFFPYFLSWNNFSRFSQEIL